MVPQLRAKIARVAAQCKSARVVKLSNFNAAFIEAIKQAGIDAQLPEILAQRLPVGAAATDRTVMDSDHSITPDICHGFA